MMTTIEMPTEERIRRSRANGTRVFLTVLGAAALVPVQGCNGTPEAASGNAGDLARLDWSMSKAADGKAEDSANEAEGSAVAEGSAQVLVPSTTALVERIATKDELLAGLMASEPTRVRRLFTPFLHKGVLFHITILGDNHPLFVAVGCTERETVILTDSTEQYARFARSAGLALGTALERRAYASVFLELLLGVWVAADVSVDSLTTPSHASDESKKQAQAIRRALEEHVVNEHPADSEWVFTRDVIHDGSIICIRLSVSKDGALELSKREVANSVPSTLGQ